MNKTPDEIRAGVASCARSASCAGCPYDRRDFPFCIQRMSADAQSHIQHLEASNTKLIEKVEQLTAKCHQLERERDAAVNDLRMGVCCGTCIYDDTDATEPPCATCEQDYSFGNWEWRGVKEDWQ